MVSALKWRWGSGLRIWTWQSKCPRSPKRNPASSLTLDLVITPTVRAFIDLSVVKKYSNYLTGGKVCLMWLFNTPQHKKIVFLKAFSLKCTVNPFPSKQLPVLPPPLPPPPSGSSDEVSLEQESEDDMNSSRTSLDKQTHHRANTTMHVCWHRNTSVSMSDHSLAVEVLLLCPLWNTHTHSFTHPHTLITYTKTDHKAWKWPPVLLHHQLLLWGRHGVSPSPSNPSVIFLVPPSPPGHCWYPAFLLSTTQRLFVLVFPYVTDKDMNNVHA